MGLSSPSETHAAVETIRTSLVLHLQSLNQCSASLTLANAYGHANPRRSAVHTPEPEALFLSCTHRLG